MIAVLFVFISSSFQEKQRTMIICSVNFFEDFKFLLRETITVLFRFAYILHDENVFQKNKRRCTISTLVSFCSLCAVKNKGKDIHITWYKILCSKSRKILPQMWHIYSLNQFWNIIATFTLFYKTHDSHYRS